MKTVAELAASPIPYGVISGCNAVLMATAYARVMREKVDAVYLEVLNECPLYADRYPPEDGSPPAKIVSPNRLYLSKDDAAVAETIREAQARLRERGVAKPDLPEGHCPALLAENVQMTAEHILIQCAAEWFDVPMTPDEFLDRITDDMDRYHALIDLLLKLYVNSPQFDPKAFPVPVAVGQAKGVAS